MIRFIRHKTLRMVKFNPITAFMKTYAKLKKKIRGFGLNIFLGLNFKSAFRLIVKKTVFYLNGYSTVVLYFS